jgi:hypothetical protein
MPSTQLAQGLDGVLHGRDRGERREGDHRLRHVELKLSGGSCECNGEIEPDHLEAELIDSSGVTGLS